MRDYVLAMTRELCRYPIVALRAEALHYQGAAHGHHHERCLEDYGELARWMLGLCFCPSCTDQGTRHGADVPALTARCRAYLTGVFSSAAPARPADAPSLTETCGPDIHAYLAARTATVTDLARAATHEAARAGVRLTLLDETIPAQSYATGHGFDPARVAVRAELGVDPHTLAQAGVHLEEPVYLTEPADAAAAIAWYRRQTGPSAPLSLILRPGPPDTPSPRPPSPAPGHPAPIASAPGPSAPGHPARESRRRPSPRLHRAQLLRLRPLPPPRPHPDPPSPLPALTPPP